MTIITKPITEKKLDQKGALLDHEIGLATAPHDGQGDVEAPRDFQGDAHIVIIRNRAKRISSSTTLCLFLTGLFVISVGVIGGTYLYRQYIRSQTQNFKGWCEIPLGDRSVDPMLSDSFNAEARIFNKDNQFELMNEFQRPEFKEHFDLDLENNQYENIDVPDFDGGRRGRFIHDFYANKTGIIDEDQNRCFVMPLNRDMVLQPRSMFDLIQKMWGGYYEVDTERVRETMKVITPPITEKSEMGAYIQQECLNMTVYRLEKYDPKVVKRSVPIHDEMFVMFAGKKTLELDINFVDL